MTRGAGFKVELQGFKELEAFLKQLGRKPGLRMMRKAIKPAAERMEQAVRQDTPIHEGELIRSIVTKFVSSSKFGNFSGEVGGEYYGRFVETGHALVRERVLGSRKIKQKGARYGSVVGHVKAHPFIVPAFERLQASLQKQIIDILEAELLKMWKQHVKKA